MARGVMVITDQTVRRRAHSDAILAPLTEMITTRRDDDVGLRLTPGSCGLCRCATVVRSQQGKRGLEGSGT